ncbi:exonuclease 3'-5' domain-containing protein 2 [Copidosoma floridanum]|uniref:exonuclease 3'-5' domain-containing protein 2 n=1 Tax=Copidosoma floridanum TaxID=29053 RepID=UPI0006C95B4D|nr:exonuclease 3'-5' domain-containing protein 2 [Copidosoma floridanum]
MLVSVCVTLGLALLASRYRDNVLRSVKRLCQGIAVSMIPTRANNHPDTPATQRHQQPQQKLLLELNKDVILADSPELCEYAVQRIRCNSSDRVLGFDCEWVNEGPVSLLQLATRNGVCALFRLNKIGHIPQGLKELLASRELLKVGVGSGEDGRRIAKDYKCQVLGSVDLRNLANRLGLTSPRSLAGFCVHYLGIEMDKAPEVRCGDWNAERLADEQIAYAATDALVSVLIYHEILKKVKQKRTLWESCKALVKQYLYRIHTRNIDADSFGLPPGVIDARYKNLNDSSLLAINKVDSTVDSKNGQLISISNNKLKSNSIPVRSKPLYHNCYLQAPDGEILCTCDKKKAEWYVFKQLGDVVQEDPFTIRLKFEPSGRALGEVGRYYTQVKKNQCVVCGTSDKFVRKNVVPREYRKYFPIVMKSHQSHDILLLCPTCHQNSNFYDLQLRRELAEKCDAPLLAETMASSRNEIPPKLKLLKTAVKVLRDSKTTIPLARRQELEALVLAWTGYPVVTPEMLHCLHEQLMKEPLYRANHTDPTKRTLLHGPKVVEYFKNRGGGLMELEKLWREHFLKTMKPKYLPELWSVSHNQERLNIRYDESRIEPKDAILAGIK